MTRQNRTEEILSRLKALGLARCPVAIVPRSTTRFRLEQLQDKYPGATLIGAGDLLLLMPELRRAFED